jgi:hypothetical protein
MSSTDKAHHTNKSPQCQQLFQICDDLRDGRLLAGRTIPERYANLDRNKPHVVSIAVRPIKLSE